MLTSPARRERVARILESGWRSDKRFQFDGRYFLRQRFFLLSTFDHLLSRPQGAGAHTPHTSLCNFYK